MVITLGERIKELRLKKDLSQDELAKILSMKNRSSIANWEADRISPDNETIKKIASFFDVSVDFLMGQELSPVQERVYKIIGDSGDLTPEEWQKIFDNFETIVAGIKAQRKK